MDRKRASAAAASAAAAASSALDHTGPVKTTPTNKDSFTYAKERDRFLKDLRQFHEERGSTIPRWPYVGGKPLDLYALYTAVTQLGGWEKVSNDETWADIQDQFGIPAFCGNADHALRQIYIRYLNAYEKIHHFGQDPDSREDVADLDDHPSSRKKSAGPVGGTALTYNYQQHNISDATREMLGLPKEPNRQNEYANLERSLMSGLPNELDFAVNICLLLSTEGKHTLKGVRGLRIIELLLSHVGICKEGELALIWLMSDSKLNFLRFWNETVDDMAVKELVCPECLLVDRVEEFRLENSEIVDEINSTLHVGRSLGMEDREAQRVIQLAVIIRNLSFEEESLEPFSSSIVLFRFLMLCVYNKHGCIRQLALDMMANIAFKIDVLFLHKMTLEPVDCGMTQLVLKTVSSCLMSTDKFEVVSALEMLSRLCQMEANEDAICCQLDEAIYEHLLRLLTIQDLQLIVSALETIYQLSEIGSVTSNHIAKVRASVDTLVALLTIEAQVSGPNCLQGIAVVEQSAEIQNPVQGPAMGPPAARPLSVFPRPPLPPPASHQQQQQTVPTPMSPSFLPPRPPLPVQQVPSSSVVAASPVACSVKVGSVPAALDNEAAVCNWLQSQYEVSANGALTKMEMYRKYVSVFSVYGLQHIVNPTCFANCIRVAFPNIEQGSLDKDGTNEVIYKGLAMRQKPGPFPSLSGDLHQTGPSDSGTAKSLLPLMANNSSAVLTFPTIQQVLLSNHTRPDPSCSSSSDGAPALVLRPNLTASSETSFVKTLLATKVVQNMNRFQYQQQAEVQGHLPSAGMQLVGTTPSDSSSFVCTVVDASASSNRDSAANISGVFSNSVQPTSNCTGNGLSLNQNVPSNVNHNEPCNRIMKANVLPADGTQIVLNEHSYILTIDPASGNKLEFRRFESLNQTNAAIAGTLGNSDTGTSVVANSASTGVLTVGSEADGCLNSGSRHETGLNSVAEKGFASEAVCSSSNRSEQKNGSAGESQTVTSSIGLLPTHLNTLTVAMNGVCLPTEISDRLETVEKSASETKLLQCKVDGSITTDWTNGKELPPSLNGMVKCVINGDCLLGRSLGNEVQMDTADDSDKISDVKPVYTNDDSGAVDGDQKSRQDILQDNLNSENCSKDGSLHSSSTKNSPVLSRDEEIDDKINTDSGSLSPFPSILSNVDGISDNATDQLDSQISSQAVNVNGQSSNSSQIDVAERKLGLDNNSQGIFVEGLNAAVTDNSDILMLEDFTIAHEEVLISDSVQEPSAMLFEAADDSSNPIPAQCSLSESEPNPASRSLTKSSPVTVTSLLPELQQPVIASHPPDHKSQNTAEGTVFANALQPMPPISIPANIQAKLASFQLNSVSFPMNIPSRIPLTTLRTPVSQSPNSAVIPNPVGSAPMTFFNPLIHANDTGQCNQSVTNFTTSTSTGLSQLETPMNQVQSIAVLPNQSLHHVEATGTLCQATNSGLVPSAAAATNNSQAFLTNQSNASLVSQNQLIVNHPQGIQQQAVHPLLEQANSTGCISSSTNSAAGQVTRLQFLPSTSLSSPSRPSQVRFVSTTTPQGHIIIQRAQLVQQPQQQQSQPQQRPLQQPIIQRIIVSQAGGITQRQILIQPNQMLLHQGANMAGHGRPMFIQQTSAGPAGQQMVVQTSSGPILATGTSQQQRHVVQAGQLTGYRLAPIVGQSGQVIGQQVIGQRPLIMQQTTQMGTGQQVFVQQGHVVNQQDLKTGQIYTNQGQTSDQQNPSQGQVLLQGQVGQMITQQGQVFTQQGQVGHMFTQQGQLLLGQQGQIICHTGQQGQMNSQNSGPVLVQHSGQIMLQSASGGLQNCIMFQPGGGVVGGGLGRMVDANKDHASPSLASSLGLPNTAASYRLATANAPLQPGSSVQQLQSVTPVQTPQQLSVNPPASPSSSTCGSNSSKKRKPATSQSRSAKKRKKDGEDQSDGDATQGRGQPIQYTCEWSNCQRSFGSFNTIYHHFTKDHFEANKESSIVCEWAGCDSLKRQRWSFMTHIQDRHLNEASLRTAAEKRPQQQSTGPASPVPSAPPVPPPVAVYPPNAALQAIRRFSARPPFPEMLDVKEGPVTKHIHLTSALILRNLARYSSLGRSLIKKHEKHLAYIALSDTESSSAISNCLWELQGL